jgi:translation initiation factor 5B
MRVKGSYIHHQKIRGAMGIKISAPGLESAIAGSELFKANTPQEVEDAKEEIEGSLIDILDKYVDKTSDGVCVQASTLGSLEALLEFLRTSKIPVSSISIGPVYKKDVQKAMKVLAQENVKKEYATLLAFDVRVTPEAQHFADTEGIKIFTAKIIYHLFDEFTAYLEECQNTRKSQGGADAVFPCALEIIKDAIFRQSNPIILGVNVKAGILKVGTPLCIPERDNLLIGKVESIEKDKKSVTKVLPKDGSVAIRVSGVSTVSFGRHFDESHQICSWLTRRSIDALKDYFRDELTMDDWKLVKALKTKYLIE